MTAVDILPEKVEKLNRYISPIQDDYIERYLAEATKGKRSLRLTATTDGAAAYASADFIIIAAPTNYDPKQNFFNCSAVTGSPGFIGANLVLRLLKEMSSGTVLSLDNMNNYYGPALKEYRLGLIKKAAQASSVHHIFIKVLLI